MVKRVLNSKSVGGAPPDKGQIELWDALVPGFGLRVSAGGARSYFVMRRLNGRLVRRTLGRAYLGDGPTVEGEYRLPEAREKARQMLSDLQRGIDPKAAAAAAAEHAKQQQAKDAANTFDAIAAAYFADPGKRGGASLRSRAELERKVRVDLKAWHDRPISDITRADVRALLRAKSQSSPVSANRLLALVRRILRWALREELVLANAALDIEPTPEVERGRVLSLAELGRIWEACMTLGYPFGPLIKLLILTGQRRSEVAELKWSEIDGNVWRLPDARAKRGKGHLVPLAPRVVAILADLPRMGSKPELVFTTGRRRSTQADGEELPPAPVAGWSRAKLRLDRLIAEQAAAKAEEPVDMRVHALRPAWTLHDIRRSVATHLRDGDVMGEDRVDRLIVSKILNHSEGGMTRLYDRYSADPEQRRALQAWAARIESLTGENVVSMEAARA